ncbi:MAG: isoprenylcysteine carboxylmethyltransferase family protein [Desulfobacterales bacterium]|nr:MAG: isoprenylcysteine carboxylmethyltransferase family protein [Desulfobacterales bacterium]
MIWVKTIIFTILAPGTVTILLPYCLLRIHQNPPPIHSVISAVIGPSLIGLGLVIYLLCAWDFASTGKGTPAPLEPPKNLVVGSLYRVSRNPMYIGIVSILIGESVFFQSAILGGYTVLVFICFHIFVRYYEEPTLAAQFGAEYIRYCRRVPRWLIRRSSCDRSAEARRLPED